jgi:UDP-glucose 6-dehydrogenase
VASNPEFLREGTAVGDFYHPDRIVVGVQDESAADLREIYLPILEHRFHCSIHHGECLSGNDAAFLVTTISSAELIKHASNSLLALEIGMPTSLPISAKKSVRMCKRSLVRWVWIRGLAGNLLTLALG